MRILLLNQTFYPDVMATAQYLTDLALALVARGHEVTVITGRRAYDDPRADFPAKEIWNGVRINRVRGTRLGKSAKWKRAVDFGSFMASCAWRLMFAKRPDVVVALTSPPLISFLAACFARWRGCAFVYWVMDLNPDEAIAAGWLREQSFAAKALHAMSVFSFRTAAHIVVLDRFMRERVRAKTIPAEKIEVMPPWSQDDAVRFDPAGRCEFRAAHGFTDKFVVMYSGNHSPCHPLTNVLEAARELSAQGDDSIRFCFVGGGSEFATVKRFAAQHRLGNIVCLSYQPLEKLAASLSAADLHVVVMGEPFVGTIHPCKIYNILAVGTPVLYIGAGESHITDIAGEAGSTFSLAHVAQGDVPNTVRAILDAKARDGSQLRESGTHHHFGKDSLLPRLVSVLESAGRSNCGF